MKLTPKNPEDWERFWLISFGTLVIGLVAFRSQFSTVYLARRASVEWLPTVLLLATAALGVYSVVLLMRGRLLLAAIGFAIFALGAWWSVPTLAK